VFYPLSSLNYSSGFGGRFFVPSSPCSAAQVSMEHKPHAMSCEVHVF
jgi:hypothetical protein